MCCRYHRVNNKKTSRWCVYPVKKQKTYTHVFELMDNVVKKRLQDREGMQYPRVLDPTDPRRLALTIAATEPPPTSELVEMQKSRMPKN